MIRKSAPITRWETFVKHMRTDKSSLGRPDARQRDGERRVVTLPARMTWKDQRGATRFATVTIRNVSDRGVYVRSSITQFGWQWEKQFYTRGSGVTMVTEWVGLLGGLDQGVALPSLSWMVGVRSHDGAEFGLGPNVTPAGVALVLAAGMTFRSGAFNVPINIAVVPSKSGSRVSLMTGFSLRR